MKRTILLVITFILLIFSGCSSSKHAVAKKQLTGVWGLKGEQVNDFRIYNDSIYSIYAEKSYKYILTENDSLVIFNDTSPHVYKVFMKGADTMIFIARDSTKSYFIRAK